jgi:prophage maintenance system killer protein
MFDPYDPTDEFDDEPRIDELPISAEDIVERNLRIFHSTDEFYETIHSYRRTVWEIENEESHKQLQKILAEFPYDKLVEEQCAYWVRAISGVHPFQDANHRTATLTLRYVLNYNGFNVEEWGSQEIGEYVEMSKELKRAGGGISVTLENLHEEDELFELWKEFFENRLR